MKSIQGRLNRGLVFGMGALFLVAGLLVDQEIERRTLSDFDSALSERARALAGMLEQEEGRVLLEFDPTDYPEFLRQGADDYYEVRSSAGEVLYLSDSTGGRPLSPAGLPPRLRHPGTQNLSLPDGRRGRALLLRFQPRVELPDADDAPGAVPPGAAAISAVPHLAKPVTVELLVARERGSLDAFVARVRTAVAVLFATLLAATAAIISWTLRRELAPVRSFAAQLGDVDAESLATPLRPAGLPAELAPVAARVDELLHRLHASFERERSFSTHLAHELRTPLAELRALVDVALRWPDDPRELALALQEAGAIQTQMQGLIVRLLTLARAGTDDSLRRASAVDLHAAVERAIEFVQRRLEAREIAVENGLPRHRSVLAPVEALDLVLSNLAANAAAHAPPGSRLRLAFDEGTGTLTFSNPAPDLEAADLPHLFDRFWRKSQARSAGDHVGLGLSLVRSLARGWGGEASATLEHGELAVAVSGLRVEERKPSRRAEEA